MSINREALRRKAKKAYKENVKNIPRGKRIPFAQFFKQYRSTLGANNIAETEVSENHSEDFDFEDLVNISEIDDDLEETIDEE